MGYHSKTVPFAPWGVIVIDHSSLSSDLAFVRDISFYSEASERLRAQNFQWLPSSPSFPSQTRKTHGFCSMISSVQPVTLSSRSQAVTLVHLTICVDIMTLSLKERPLPRDGAGYGLSSEEDLQFRSGLVLEFLRKKTIYVETED
jgi:hypothetical protein